MAMDAGSCWFAGVIYGGQHLLIEMWKRLLARSCSTHPRIRVIIQPGTHKPLTEYGGSQSPKRALVSMCSKIFMGLNSGLI